MAESIVKLLKKLAQAGKRCRFRVTKVTAKTIAEVGYLPRAYGHHDYSSAIF